jgi:tetratricopeptide (TPR) repeat protein
MTTILHDLTRRSYRVLLFDELEEYESAIAMLSEHLRANPMDGVAYNNRGLAYAEIGRGEQALLDFENAIRFSREDPIPYVNRGDLYQRVKPVGKFAEAIEDYSSAIVIEPNNETFHRSKAHACLKINRLQEAVASFGAAISLDPKFRQTYIDRAEAYKRIGDSQKADLDLLEASKLPQRPTR